MVAASVDAMATMRSSFTAAARRCALVGSLKWSLTSTSNLLSWTRVSLTSFTNKQSLSIAASYLTNAQVALIARHPCGLAFPIICRGVTNACMIARDIRFAELSSSRIIHGAMAVLTNTRGHCRMKRLAENEKRS
jgi:hypothetical protein